MVDVDAVAYNIAVFITALFLLESGADKFIDHTAIVARRIGVSETIFGLVTAGAEWEELIVVVAALARGRASLAIGNIIGSAVSNILGAFSLGLLFHSKHEPVRFDRSSRVYSLVLLAITTLTAPILLLPASDVWLIHGTLLIACFAVYVASVGWAISRGTMTASECSDSDSSSDSDSEAGLESESTDTDEATAGTAARRRRTRYAAGTSHAVADPPLIDVDQPTPSVPSSPAQPPPRRKTRALRYHVFQLLFGFFGISLAGYVLSHAASTLVDELHMSDVLFGVAILSVATTLPEKFVAVLSGHRGHVGVLVANTAGSNIFLLTLCAGIVVLDTKGHLPRGNVGVLELGVLWGSTATFTATVWFGGKFGRWIGGVMVVAYTAFVVLEVVSR